MALHLVTGANASRRDLAYAAIGLGLALAFMTLALASAMALGYATAVADLGGLFARAVNDVARRPDEPEKRGD